MAVLKIQFAAKDSDAVAINLLMNAMHLLKYFILRIEMKTGVYSDAFKEVNDRDVIEALFLEPVDPMLDTADETTRKNHLISLHGEAKLLFQTLDLGAKVVFDLNKWFQVETLQLTI